MRADMLLRAFSPTIAAHTRSASCSAVCTWARSSAVRGRTCRGADCAAACSCAGAVVEVA